MTAQYRKLPGKRRGFFNVSSVWAGPDHLLLVRGTRFREEYKRFYYRDVQAIAVARASRFQISTRSASLALIALIVCLVTIVRGYNGPVGYAAGGLGIVALGLAGVWLYLSAAQSCYCRIYTAVSGDDLPSVYRMWTARAFLADVESLIAATQGKIDGDWAAAAEERAVGPGLASATPSGTALEPSSLPRRGLASDLFLASLFADALARILRLPAPVATWLPVAMELLTVAGAIAVVVQHNRGRLRAGMQRVAVASLIAFGTLYYVQSISVGITASMTAAKTKKQTTALAFQQSRLSQEVGAGIDAILLIVGLIISLREDDTRRSGLLG